MAGLIVPVGEGDAADIAAFFRSARERDPALGAPSADEWRRLMASPHNRGGRDFRLLREGGAIAGIATPTRHDGEDPRIRYFRIVVAPERRRRGIGSALLRHIVEMDGAEDVLLQSLCPEDWTAMAAFLAANGFTLVETELRMVRAVDSSDAGPRGGVSIRKAAEAASLAGELAAIHNGAYAGTPSCVRLTGAAFTALLDDSSRLLAAEEGGAIRGFCHLTLGNGESWIENVAVEPRHQGRGLGRALVAAALGEAGRSGSTLVSLAVSDRNERAQALYRHLGFDIVAKSARYRAKRAAVLAALKARGR